jgi:uncharacterized protein (DUF2062 family)
MEMHHIHAGEMLRWTTFFKVGLPLLIGSLFFAAPAALLFYFVLLAILKARNSLGEHITRYGHAGLSIGGLP